MFLLKKKCILTYFCLFQYNEMYVMSWAVVATAINCFQIFILTLYFMTMDRSFDLKTDTFAVIDICE